MTERQHLIFDADDTLWENNIYFEEAFEEFCEFLSHSTLTPAEVRRVLDEIELESNKVHGYGTLNFGRNLQQCFTHLAERGFDDGHLRQVEAIAHRIFDSPMELRPGVIDTLPVLGERHELTMFTKGHSDEQNRKINRSGLRGLFRHCEVTREKNREAYASLAADRGLALERTWMIGNSPKSDINPALAAGMGAVYVPHERTWALEREDLPDSHPRLRRVDKFTDLKALFG